MLEEIPKLDDLDLALIDALRLDAKASNTELADRLGVAKRTVASRIARLAKKRVMRVTATFDIQGVGFNLLSILTIRVKGRPVEDVAAEFVRMAEAQSVQSTLGACDLLVTLVSRDRAHLIDLIENDVGRIPGVDDLRCEQVLSTRSLHTDLGVLREELLSETPREFFDALDHSDIGFGLDELDRLVITSLQENGRTPLTQIARVAGVSEGTVRFRLKRLESNKRLRISTVVDARSIGFDASAYVALRVQHARLNEVADRLAETEGVLMVAVTLSHADMWLATCVKTRTSLATLIQDRIAMLPSVQSARSFEIVHLYKHDYRWNMRMALDSESTESDPPAAAGAGTPRSSASA